MKKFILYFLLIYLIAIFIFYITAQYKPSFIINESNETIEGLPNVEIVDIQGGSENNYYLLTKDKHIYLIDIEKKITRYNILLSNLNKPIKFHIKQHHQGYDSFMVLDENNNNSYSLMGYNYFPKEINSYYERNKNNICIEEVKFKKNQKRMYHVFNYKLDFQPNMILDINNDTNCNPFKMTTDMDGILGIVNYKQVDFNNKITGNKYINRKLSTIKNLNIKKFIISNNLKISYPFEQLSEFTVVDRNKKRIYFINIDEQRGYGKIDNYKIVSIQTEKKPQYASGRINNDWLEDVQHQGKMIVNYEGENTLKIYTINNDSTANIVSTLHNIAIQVIILPLRILPSAFFGRQ